MATTITLVCCYGNKHRGGYSAGGDAKDTPGMYITMVTGDVQYFKVRLCCLSVFLSLSLNTFLLNQ